MKQELVQHHWTVEAPVHSGLNTTHTVPAGGCTYGPGLCISWQNGPLGRDPNRKPPNGCFVEAVIQAAIGRLEFYQSTPFRCPENQVALDHLHRALGALEARTADREARNVEGTHKK
jgi:hypothetical protein